MGESRIRVLLTASSLPIGGMEQVVFDLAMGLDRAAFEPHICCLEELGAVGERLRDRGIPTHQMRSPRGPDPGLPIRFAKLLRREQFNIVHCHDSWAMYHSVLGCRLLGVPLVQTRHGYLVNRSPRQMHFNRLFGPWISEVVAVSNAHRRDILRKERVPPSKVSIIHNGIVMHDMVAGRGPGKIRRAFQWPEHDPVVGNVANVQAEKDQACLVMAMPEVLKQVPGARLVIVGGFPDPKLAAELASLIEELGLGDHVKLMGSCSDARELIGDMTLFVLSSRTEGFPISVLEAMAAARPVVATHVGGIAEAVEEGRTGILVPSRDPQALAAAVSSLLRDPGRLAEMGMAGRRRAETLFSHDRMVADYEALYRKHVFRLRSRPVKTPAAVGAVSKGGCNVLVVGPAPPPPGGMETYVGQMLRASFDGYVLRLLNTSKTTPPDRPLIAGVVSQAALFLRLLSLLATERPRLAHVHTASWLSFYRRAADVAAARLLGSRVILHIHGGSFLRFCESASPLGRHVIKWTLRAADRVIALSPDFLKPLAAVAGAERLRVIPNGVDLSLFGRRAGPRRADPRRAVGIPPDAHVILFMGTLLGRKGILDLARALGDVAGSDSKALLIIAGPEGEPGVVARLVEIVKRTRVEQHVRLMGPVGGDLRINLFLSADVFVLPSYSENMPMSVLEAFASGLPVVGTPVGCVPDMVAEGINGYLVNPGDPGALADRLLALLGDKDLRQRMGEANRAKAVREYDFSWVVSQLKAEYQAVVGDGPVEEARS